MFVAGLYLSLSCGLALLAASLSPGCAQPRLPVNPKLHGTVPGSALSLLELCCVVWNCMLTGCADLYRSVPGSFPNCMKLGCV